MTRENLINLKFDQFSEEALGLFLFMYLQFDPLNQYDYKSPAASANPPMEAPSSDSHPSQDRRKVPRTLKNNVASSR